MPMSSSKSELLSHLEAFHISTKRQPCSKEMERIQRLIRNLTETSPAPDLHKGLPCLAGLWKCIFTSSRFVLGLNRLRVAQLSDVYQYVAVETNGQSGHYFNIGEMSRGGKVRGACGEYALIRASSTERGQLHVEYKWFYTAFRVWLKYEGASRLAGSLEAGRVAWQIRLPFNKTGWQQTAYLDEDLRVVFGSEGGIFILIRESGVF